MVFEIIAKFMEDIFGGLNLTLIRLFIAILIFLFGFIIGKLVGRIVLKVLNELNFNNFIKKVLGIRVNAESILSSFLSYIIYILALLATMEKLGVANIILYLISFLLICMILISFFLAIKDFLPNFIAGIYLYSREHLRRGTLVEIGDIKGRFLQIDMLHIRLETAKGDIIYIPNTTVANSRIKVLKISSKPQA